MKIEDVIQEMRYAAADVSLLEPEDLVRWADALDWEMRPGPGAVGNDDDEAREEIRALERRIEELKEQIDAGQEPPSL